MSDLTWPVDLPQLPLRQGYKGAFGENRIRTDMDSGPPKSRRRSTKRVDKQTAILHVTTAQLALFKEFYEAAGDGTLSFDYPNVETGEVVTVQFGDDPPSWVPAKSPGYWDVTVNLELV